MFEKITVIIVAFLMVMTLSTPAMAYRPQDIKETHWALDYISPLLDDGIMYVYKDGNFKANKAITRGEFAYSLAKAMKIKPAMVTDFSDISNHFAKGYIGALAQAGIISGYPDNTFRPNNKITRAEIVTMIGRSLSLDDKKKNIALNENFYFDIDQNHWASNLIALASRLNLINGYPDGEFKPNNYVTRAESSKLLYNSKRLEGIEAKIVEAYPAENKITVETKVGKRTLDLASNTLIGRNNRLVSIDNMFVSDTAYLLLNEYNQITYLKAYGLVTKEDVATKVSDYTKNLLSSEELLAIARGDWDSVTPRLEQEVTMTMLKEGFSIHEIHALLTQDWTSLETTARDRLIGAIAKNTNLPKELIIATYQKDWDTAKALAKTKAITSVIQQVISKSDLLS